MSPPSLDIQSVITEQLTSPPAEDLICGLEALWSDWVVVVSATTEITGSEPQASMRLDPRQLATFDRACHSATSPRPISQALYKT